MNNKLFNSAAPCWVQMRQLQERQQGSTGTRLMSLIHGKSESNNAGKLSFNFRSHGPF